MRRSRFAIVLLTLVTGVATLVVAAQVRPAAPRPNIILIQADDLGYGDLSAYGQSNFQTPSLDRMAREGTRFTQYYAGSTVCAPSRTSLLTGLHSGHASIRGNAELPLPEADVTVAMAMRDAGYRTAVIGKWGLGQPATSGVPARKGFEYSFGFLDQRHAHRQFTDHLFRDAESVAVDLTKDYVNDLFTREATSFIERPDARPFLLYLNYTVPHAELRVPEDSIAPYVGKFPEKPFVNATADGKQTGPDGPSLGYRSQPTPKAAFAGMITRMDRDVGRILDLLKARGVDANTLVMFASDNGPHQEGGADPQFFKSSGGLRGIKRDLYEGGIRVPMIARWPGQVPAGRVSTHVWAHWDLFPTIAELGGAKVPKGVDGLSMTRALRGQAQPTHEFLYWEFHERGFQQAARMGDWKAVRPQKDQPLEIYNLKTDPTETHNVAATQPAIVRRFETYFKTARTDDPRWPMKGPPTTAPPVATTGTAAGTLAPTAQPAPSFGSQTSIATPAPRGAAQPQLTVDRQGRVVLSWLEPRDGGGHRFRFARRVGEAWSEPITIAEGDRFIANWADVPALFVSRTGAWAAHWLERHGTSREAYDVKLRTSVDEGRTWSPVMTPHRDNADAEHGFVSFFDAPGGLGLTWLDGRDAAGHAAGAAHDPMAAAMSLRATTISGATMQTLGREALVDPRVCDCCPTAAASTSNGVLVAYRDRSADEVRDIYVARRVNSTWAAPVRVHEDAWQIAACPVNGPAIAARGASVAVAWTTGAGGQVRVKMAWSTDAGRTFGVPIRLDVGAPIGRVAVVMPDDRRAIVSWIEPNGGTSKLVMREVTRDGRVGPTTAVADMAASRQSGFPRMIVAGSRLMFAWTHASTGVPLEVRMAATDLLPLPVAR